MCINRSLFWKAEGWLVLSSRCSSFLYRFPTWYLRRYWFFYWYSLRNKKKSVWPSYQIRVKPTRCGPVKPDPPILLLDDLFRLTGDQIHAWCHKIIVCWTGFCSPAPHERWKPFSKLLASVESIKISLEGTSRRSETCSLVCIYQSYDWCEHIVYTNIL